MPPPMHGWAIRRDGQLEQVSQSDKLADVSVVVIDGEDGKLGQAIIGWLQRDLPGLQLKPIALTPQAAEVLAVPPFSPTGMETIRLAHYIIGPWQSLTAPEVAAAVTASPALKLAVPTVAPNWIWAGVKRQSSDYYAHQAVRSLKQAIEGAEINSGGELNLGSIVAIIVGVLVLLFVFVGLFGIFASF